MPRAEGVRGTGGQERSGPGIIQGERGTVSRHHVSLTGRRASHRPGIAEGSREKARPGGITTESFGPVPSDRPRLALHGRRPLTQPDRRGQQDRLTIARSDRKPATVAGRDITACAARHNVLCAKPRLDLSSEEVSGTRVGTAKTSSGPHRACMNHTTPQVARAPRPDLSVAKAGRHAAGPRRQRHGDKAQCLMAETKGFEPSRRFPAYSLSRGAPSTTRPRLRRPV